MSRSAAHDARNKAYREVLGGNAAAAAAAIPTARFIPTQAKQLDVKWEVEDVRDGQGGRIHWVGDRSAKKVILYFHGDYLPTRTYFGFPIGKLLDSNAKTLRLGGGYGLPIFPGNMIFFVQSQQKLAEKGKNVVLAFLEYGKLLYDRYNGPKHKLQQ